MNALPEEARALLPAAALFKLSRNLLPRADVLSSGSSPINASSPFSSFLRPLLPQRPLLFSHLKPIPGVSGIITPPFLSSSLGGVVGAAFVRDSGIYKVETAARFSETGFSRLFRYFSLKERCFTLTICGKDSFLLLFFIGLQLA